MSVIKVLFVCMGNICRSPTAHGIFKDKVKAKGLEKKILVDSAGTHAYHVGESPDRRSQATARHHGYDLSDQQARQVSPRDFSQFDYIIAMDNNNLSNLMELASDGQKAKIHLCMSFAKHHDNTQVPDPYYNTDGFEDVLKMIEDASEGLLERIEQELQ